MPDVLAGFALMKVLAKDDLVSRTAPRLEKFHSLENGGSSQRGITHWRKGYFEADYCQAKNAYVCQRSAVAGSASEANGD